MIIQNYFFSIFLLTIILIRFWLLIKPISSPKIKGFKLHHYMYGLLIIVFSFFVSNIILYAIGLGLFVDELPLLIKYNGKFHWKEYNSIYSRAGLVICIIIVFIFNRQILSLLYL